MIRLIGKISSKYLNPRPLIGKHFRYQIPSGQKNICVRASKAKDRHTKLGMLGVGVCLSAIALPSPWSWVAFIMGLQLFAPIVGRALKNNSDAERQRIIADIHARLDALDREILKGDPNETGLTTHNKRIEYNTLARLLERLSKED